jgi:hypothetical protein
VQKSLLICTGIFPFLSGCDWVYSAAWGNFLNEKRRENERSEFEKAALGTAFIGDCRFGRRRASGVGGCVAAERGR